MKIHCPHCDRNRDLSKFFRNAGRATGASVLCKDCFSVYEGSPERRAKRTWNTIRARVERQAAYAHVEVRMTRDEFLAWAIPAYIEWMGANDGTPSVDRIDPNGHYEIKNIRILERGENCRISRRHPNVSAPDGKAWCGTCKTYLPSDNFYHCARTFNGLQGRCKSCLNEALKRSALKR